jgi:hypothetical protein
MRKGKFSLTVAAVTAGAAGGDAAFGAGVACIRGLAAVVAAAVGAAFGHRLIVVSRCHMRPFAGWTAAQKCALTWQSHESNG